MLNDTPIDVGHSETRAAHLLDLAGAAVMIDMGMGDQHIFDVFRIQTQGADAVKQRIARLRVGRIDHHQSGACADQKRTDALSTHIVDVIEDFERVDLLLTYWRPAPGLAPWRFQIPFAAGIALSSGW